jgi:hypothetical protein
MHLFTNLFQNRNQFLLQFHEFCVWQKQYRRRKVMKIIPKTEIQGTLDGQIAGRYDVDMMLQAAKKQI